MTEYQHSEDISQRDALNDVVAHSTSRNGSSRQDGAESQHGRRSHKKVSKHSKKSVQESGGKNVARGRHNRKNRVNSSRVVRSLGVVHGGPSATSQSLANDAADRGPNENRLDTINNVPNGSIANSVSDAQKNRRNEGHRESQSGKVNGAQNGERKGLEKVVRNSERYATVDILSNNFQHGGNAKNESSVGNTDQSHTVTGDNLNAKCSTETSFNVSKPDDSNSSNSNNPTDERFKANAASNSVKTAVKNVQPANKQTATQVVATKPKTETSVVIKATTKSSAKIAAKAPKKATANAASNAAQATGSMAVARASTKGANKTQVKEKTRRNPKSKVGAHVKEGGKFTFDDVLYILICCLIAIVIASLLRFFVFGLYAIPSGSMEDTLEVGDHIVTNRISPKVFKLQRGDVVVFKDPANWLQSTDIYASNDLVKRVIGLPGDVVACKGVGYPVTVNGVAINESSYLKKGVQPSNFEFKVKVTPNNIFVLGDNRANSADSRYHANDGNHGLVPLGRVKGVAMLDYWPASRFKVVKSYHDVFVKVPDAAHS